MFISYGVLFPRIVVFHRTVLQGLANHLDLLVVLLAILPLLRVVDAIATGSLQGLHRRAIHGVLKSHLHVARIVRCEHPLQQLVVAIVHRFHADGHLATTGNTGELSLRVSALSRLLIAENHLTLLKIFHFQFHWCYVSCHILRLFFYVFTC